MAAGHIVIGGVDATYEDMGQGCTFDLHNSDENEQLDCVYKIAWSSRAPFLGSLRGVSTFNGGASTPYAIDPSNPARAANKGYLARVLQHNHPESTWLYCTNAGYKGYITRPSTEASLPAHDEARVKAHYEGLPYNVDTDANLARVSDGINWTVDESWFTAGSFKRYVSIQPPKDKFAVVRTKGAIWRWKDTARAAPDKLGSFFYRHWTENIITWHRVPFANVPWRSIFYCKACTNASDFGPWAAKTLIFDTECFTLIRLPDGTLGVNLHYTMTHHPEGANFFPDPERAFSFHELETRLLVGGVRAQPYPPVNFNNLLRPEAP